MMMEVAEDKSAVPAFEGEYRSCGNCTMCCKLLAIDELAKPRNKWCGHCAIGKGCNIYETKPPSCTEFQCLWTMLHKNGSMVPEEFRPDRSKCVITPSLDGGSLSVYVDPGSPRAWQDGDFGRYLRTLAARGATIIATVGTKHYVMRKEQVPFSRKPQEARLVIREGYSTLSEDGTRMDVKVKL